MFEPEYGDHLIGSIQTVLWPVPKSDLGITLMHEHVLVDQQAKERRSLRVRAKKDKIFSKGIPASFLHDWDKQTLNIDNLNYSMSNRYSIADKNSFSEISSFAHHPETFLIQFGICATS